VSPFDQKLAGLFACTVQPYSVLRHTDILWQFDKLGVQQNYTEKYRIFTYLFVILNKLFFNAYEEIRLQKYAYKKGGKYDKPSVQTQNVVALSHYAWSPVWKTLFVTAVSQVQAGFSNLNTPYVNAVSAV
jgi:hypothetical protein